MKLLENRMEATTEWHDGARSIPVSQLLYFNTLLLYTVYSTAAVQLYTTVYTAQFSTIHPPVFTQKYDEMESTLQYTAVQQSTLRVYSSTAESICSMI